MTKTVAPWSVEQVAALNRWQNSGHVHPFTCGSGNRMDASHVAYQAEHPEQDYGQLVASVNGWFCPVCSYRQNWAHHFMADPATLAPGHTDLMVTPESLDAWLAENPPGDLQ